MEWEKWFDKINETFFILLMFLLLDCFFFSVFYIYFYSASVMTVFWPILVFLVVVSLPLLKKEVVVIFFARFVPVNNVIAQHGVVHDDGVHEERRSRITWTGNGSTPESGACKCIEDYKWFLWMLILLRYYSTQLIIASFNFFLLFSSWSSQVK